jgi:hypothetical protein
MEGDVVELEGEALGAEEMDEGRGASHSIYAHFRSL